MAPFFRDGLEWRRNTFECFFAACDVCTSGMFEALELEDIVMRTSPCSSDAPLITERPEWENNTEHKHEAVWLQKATAINADLHTHTPLKR